MPHDMEPNLWNGGRWHHIASEREVKLALRDKNSTVIEAPGILMTFIVSQLHATILRCGAGGGDVFSVEGGWVYADSISFLRDYMEVKSLGGIPA